MAWRRGASFSGNSLAQEYGSQPQVIYNGASRRTADSMRKSNFPTIGNGTLEAFGGVERVVGFLAERSGEIGST
jgi:hypothetical protein